MKLSWSQRWKIALLLAISGLAYLAFAMLDEIANFSEGVAGNASMLSWVMVSTLVGALLAGLIVAPWFGKTGNRGWIFAGLAGLIGSALGGAIGGTFILPGFGTMLGPIFVFGHMMQTPILLLVWIILMAGVHLAAIRLRRSYP